jgi:hypothetical protein
VRLATQCIGASRKAQIKIADLKACAGQWLEYG